ncbi:MAG: glycosyl hydrolase [Planctomycetota bacterium]|nr:glycosyl hydrolase [Planctomycetota bacterium]
MNRFLLWSVARVTLTLAIVALVAGLAFPCSTAVIAADVLAEFQDPPREFSVMPFWFWNDNLQDEEIVRQIADFEAHGVYGFVIHPRIGLPRDISWLSPRMIRAMHVAVDEAVRRRMVVVLYDEGMYPSGSSAGQVVARNPDHAARGLAKIDLQPGEHPQLEDGWKLVALLERSSGRRLAVVERPTSGVIRGLHYLGEETGKLQEELPPAGDILNPAAVASFIELVYERYAQEFGQHFGKTILGIFTDEPSPTGRGGARGMLPGNAALLEQVNRILGYDFKPFLADLWYDDGRDAAQHRADYHRAIAICLEENYYRRLSQWCDQHGIALTGHPGGSMDIGAERYFQMPGQDLVWRMVVPGPKALEGPDSTTAKCASSAMVHLGRRRNANELYGAYGHNLTYEEMEWLASWCLVRGHNLLYPHAFYYSVRGPRKDERPPDVGPHAAWWGKYQPYADYCRRLSWLNTDSQHVCEVAILAEPARLPDQSAKACFQHQRDFNYLELRHLGEEARVEPDGVHLAGLHYRAVILDGALHVPANSLPAVQQLASHQRLIILGRSPYAAQLAGARAVATPAELLAAIDTLVKPDLTLTPASTNLRYRHVVKGGRHFYLLFNEEESPVTAQVDLSVRGRREWLDPFTAAATPAPSEEPVVFQPHQLKVLTAAVLNPSE